MYEIKIIEKELYEEGKKVGSVGIDDILVFYGDEITLFDIATLLGEYLFDVTLPQQEFGSAKVYDFDGIRKDYLTYARKEYWLHEGEDEEYHVRYLISVVKMLEIAGSDLIENRVN